MKLKNSCAAVLCVLMLITAFTVCPAVATPMDSVGPHASMPQYFISAEEYQASVPEEYKSSQEYLAFITEEYTPLPLFDIAASEVSASSSDVSYGSDDVYSTINPQFTLKNLMKYGYKHGMKKEDHFNIEYIQGSGIKAIKHGLHIDYTSSDATSSDTEWTIIYSQKEYGGGGWKEISRFSKIQDDMTDNEAYAILLIMRQIMDHNSDEFAALMGAISGTLTGITVAGMVAAIPSCGTSLIVSAVSTTCMAITAGVSWGYAYVMHQSANDAVRACINIYHDYLE